MKQKKPMSPVIKAVIGFVFFVVSGLLVGVGGLVDLIPYGAYAGLNGVTVQYGVRAAINYYIGAFGGYVFGVWSYLSLAVVAAAGVLMIIEIVLAGKKKKGNLIFPILVNAIFVTFLPFLVMVGALVAEAHALTPIATWIIVAAFALDVLAIGILLPELLPLFVPALESPNAVKKEEPKQEAAPVEEKAEEEPAGLTEEEVQKLIDEAVAKAIAEHVDEKHEEKEEAAPVKEEKAEEPVEEEKAEEPVEEEKVEEPVEEPAEEEAEEKPEGEEIPAEEADGYGSSKRRRANFETRLKNSDFDLRHKYYDLRDYIKSYGVNNRISIPGDTFSAHRKKYAFLTINGKHIRANFALNPDDYKDTPIPVTRAESKKFEDLPLQFKIRSDLSYRRALKLVDDMMAKAGFEKPEGPAKFTQDQNPDEK